MGSAPAMTCSISATSSTVPPGGPTRGRGEARRGVGGGATERPDLPGRGGEGDRAIAGRAAIGGLEADGAAERGGLADRPAGIGAEAPPPPPPPPPGAPG